MACTRRVSTLTHPYSDLTTRRFPIVAGLRVVWDHRKPPNQRVESIHLVDPGNDDDDDDEDDEDQGASADDLIDFVEQEDGTRVEVKQKKIQIGDEVKREEGGRVYRVVCRTTCPALMIDHS